LARKKGKGTPLKVFSGKEAALNRVILLILFSSKSLAKYDMFLQIKRIKGWRHVDSRTVYNRVEALEGQGWLSQKGSRLTKPGWPTELYEITLRGKVALKLDEKNIEDFIKASSEEQLHRIIDILS
jgi:hypothetical protein